MEALPFPFETLARVPLERVETLRRWARAMPFVGLTTQPWLGLPVAFEVGEAVPAAPASAQPTVGVLLERGPARFAWTLTPGLSGLVLERSLGGETGDPLLGPLTEMERGVLTYAVARWLAPSRWTVAGLFTHTPALREALGEGELLRWPMSLRLGADRFDTSLWINPTLPAPSVAPSSREDLPVTCIAQVGVATLPVVAVAALKEGDVVLPDMLSVDVRGDGPVFIRVRGAEIGFEAIRVGSELTVQRQTAGEDIRVSPGGGDVSAEIDGMEQLPVTLSLELARFELPLGDVAALAPGEVIRTGASAEKRVVLRAGDKIVAIGELVVVGDEVGVRLTEVPRTG